MTKAPRVGSFVLIVAAVIMFIGAAIPFFAPSLNRAPWADDPAELAQAIAGNPTAWAAANTLILVAGLLTALGLVSILSGFKGSGHTWAMAGLLAFSTAAVLGAIDRMISAHVFSWAADSGLDLTDSAVQAFIRLSNALGNWFAILSFSALSLFGMGMAKRPDVRGIGSLFAAAGVLGIALQLVGAAIPGFIFLGTGALGVVMLMQGSPIIAGTDGVSGARTDSA